MLDQRRLDLERRYVHAADAQHVVAAPGTGVAAVFVTQVFVTALGPLALEGIAALDAVVPVQQRRAGPAHEQVADVAVGNRQAVVAAQLDVVSRHRVTRRTETHLARPIRNVNMQHLGGADAVDDVDAEALAETLRELRRQRFAGGYREP